MKIRGLNTVLFHLLILMAMQSIIVLSSCPNGWVKWRQSCYILLPEKMNWVQAEAACKRPGSNLIVPDSREENQFIYEWAVKGNDGMWIGCTDAAQEGVWLCGGQPARFTNWNHGSPRNDMDLNCARMTIYSGGWSDNSKCSNISTKIAACEMPVPIVPIYHTLLGPDGRVSQYCPLNHVIDNLAVEGVIVCGWACTSDPRCRSFNIWQSSEKEKKCQLNNVTSIEEDNNTDSKDTEGCVYFEL
ncbi:low affinity immunoglobulin epsilon Fc receptor-like [Asterias amurensis]|uniref:low affinity immunoglobulin epsilon Fc receptor-like n=1 Tax=Asterias amurensis TaxID=7602 RepID=UPI003AB51803